MTNEQLERLLPASMSRRHLLRLGLTVAPVAVLVSACGSDDPSAVSRASGSNGTTGTTGTGGSLTPTPACDDGDETPAVTEGPFFSSGSPERTSIRDGDGTPLVVTGSVLDTACVALAGAKLDFWQANDDGEYDNSGYEFRGHQFTNAAGAFRLETIVPPSYGPRTSHIHVKVQPSGGSVLTTQLFFPDNPDNDSDDLFDAACLMDVTTVGDGQAATFNFVVEA
jgi:protocatechuate 3,4-dioxygenase beta subunit